MKFLIIVLFQLLYLWAYVFAVKSATLDITYCYKEDLRTREHVRSALVTELWVNNGYENVMTTTVYGPGQKKNICSGDGYFCISGWNRIDEPTSIQMQMNNDKRPLTATSTDINRGKKVCGGLLQGETQQYFFEIWA